MQCRKLQSTRGKKEKKRTALNLAAVHSASDEASLVPLQSLCSSSSSTSITTPAQVILLRFLAFLSCAFLVLMALYGSGDPFSLSTAGPAAGPAAVPSGPSLGNRTGSSAAGGDRDRDSGSSGQGWQELLLLLPEQLLQKLSAAWAYGKNHQMAVAVLGLFTCLLAMLLAGRIRCVCSACVSLHTAAVAALWCCVPSVVQG